MRQATEQVIVWGETTTLAFLPQSPCSHGWMWHTTAWAHVWLCTGALLWSHWGDTKCAFIYITSPTRLSSITSSGRKVHFKKWAHVAFSLTQSAKITPSIHFVFGKWDKGFHSPKQPPNCLPTPLQLFHPKSLATIRAKNSLWKPTTFLAHFKSHPLNRSLGCGHNPAFISHTHTHSLSAFPTKKGPTMQQAI